MMKKNMLVKIIVPVLIIAVVCGIWIYKNGEKKEQNTTPQAQTQNNTQEKLSDSVSDKNSDFALAATNVDLDKLKSYGLPIIIDFGADSCVPCKEMAPILKKLNEELQGKVIVKFVDVWKYQEAAANFPVQVIPTQFFFNADGTPFVPSNPDAMQMDMYSTKDTNMHVYTAHQGGMTEEQIKAVLAEMGVK